MKCSGFVLRVSELMICREAASRHQKTASPSQKPTSTSNKTVSQAVLIQKQSYPGSTGTSLPSSKQHPRGQKGMGLLCSSCHIAALTRSRHNRVLKSFQNHPRPLENGNEGKKNKKLDILLESESSLLPNDCEPRRRVTSARAALTRSSTGFRLESGAKSTSCKTARSEKILRGASHQKSLDKGIGYGSITPESRFEQCMLLLI